MDREDAFVKSIFAKSVLTIYPDPQSLGLDWSSRFKWGLLGKFENHALTTSGSNLSQCIVDNFVY